jgi:hypothetical protein
VGGGRKEEGRRRKKTKEVPWAWDLLKKQTVVP